MPLTSQGYSGGLDALPVVRELHAEFHKCAARVADLAVTGQKDEAVRMLALGGDFASVSSRLTAAMMEWKKV